MQNQANLEHQLQMQYLSLIEKPLYALYKYYEDIMGIINKQILTKLITDISALGGLPFYCFLIILMFIFKMYILSLKLFLLLIVGMLLRISMISLAMIGVFSDLYMILFFTILVILVGSSRILLKQHDIWDVLGGIFFGMLGYITVILLYRFFIILIDKH